MDVEPTLTDFGETSLDDFLKTSDPSLLSSIEADLSDGAGLDLFELFDTQSLTFDWSVIDVVICE